MNKFRNTNVLSFQSRIIQIKDIRISWKLNPCYFKIWNPLKAVNFETTAIESEFKVVLIQYWNIIQLFLSSMHTFEVKNNSHPFRELSIDKLVLSLFKYEGTPPRCLPALLFSCSAVRLSILQLSLCDWNYSPAYTLP